MMTWDDMHPLPKWHLPDFAYWQQALAILAIVSRRFGLANVEGYVQSWSVLYEKRRVETRQHKLVSES